MSAPANKPQGPINDGFFGVQEQRSGTHVDTFLNVARGLGLGTCRKSWIQGRRGRAPA